MFLNPLLENCNEEGRLSYWFSFEFDRWKTQALRAKQTHLYLLNAHKYWLMLNENFERENPAKDLKKTVEKLIELLIEEPSDFVAQLESLL